MWDGRTYFETLVTAVSGPFNPLNFNIFAHPSMLFMLVISAGQYIDPGNVVLLNVTDHLFGMAGIAAFWALCGSLFPNANRWERGLLTFAFAMHPIVIASELNFAADTGVLVFSLAYIALLLRGRFRLAVLAGLFLASSKESGVLLYAVITVVFFGLDFVREKRPLLRAIRSVLHRTALFAPALFYLATILAARAAGRAAVWTSPVQGQNDVARQFLRPRWEEIVHSRWAGGILILNFQWILTLVLLSALALLAVRIVRSRARFPPGVDRFAAAVVAAVIVAGLYLLTRIQTFTNIRYLMPLYPLLILAFGIASRFLTGREPIRIVFLAVVCALTLVSVFRTIDPVSKRVYGTFPFGRHEILNMTSLTGECCGYGRDQLVYNMEFAHFATLQDKIYEAIRPDGRTAIVKDPLTEWYLDGILDARTFRRAVRPNETVRPRYLVTTQVFTTPNRPAELYFVAYPNVDNVPDLLLLTRVYHIAETRTFEENGYQIPVFKMVLRRSAASHPFPNPSPAGEGRAK
jgi:hypothetical protein